MRKQTKIEGKRKIGKQEGKNRSNHKRGDHFQISHLYPRNFKLNLYYKKTFYVITYSESLCPCKQATAIFDIMAHHQIYQFYFETAHNDLCSQVCGLHMPLSTLGPLLFFFDRLLEKTCILFPCEYSLCTIVLELCHQDISMKIDKMFFVIICTYRHSSTLITHASEKITGNY